MRPDTFQKSYDILVGVCTKNCEDTVSDVIKTVDRGLSEFFPGRKSMIVVSDGYSSDGTREAVERTGTCADKRFVREVGTPGKGSAIKTVLILARLCGAKAVAVVDGDLESIEPFWIKHLLEPVFSGSDLVIPFYRRHRNDGVITNHILYPLFSALYKTEIRQPIGGDYGLSRRFAERILQHPLFPHNFGIDIFLTTVAVAESFRVTEAELGVKEHSSSRFYKNTDHLRGMFEEVIGMKLDLMNYYKSRIRSWCSGRDVKKLRCGTDKRPSEVVVDREGFARKFVEEYSRMEPLIRKCVSPESIETIGRITRTGEFRFPVDLWVSCVRDVLCSGLDKREKIEVLRVLWQGRYAGFLYETEGLTDDETETVIRNQVERFSECLSAAVPA